MQVNPLYSRISDRLWMRFQLGEALGMTSAIRTNRFSQNKSRLFAIFSKDLFSVYLGPTCGKHTWLLYIFFWNHSVSPTYHSWLNRLSERIAKGHNYESCPYIMLLSSKCNCSNDSKFRIYVHVKIRFTRQYRPCNYNITLDLKPLNCNKYDLFLSLGTVGD